MALTPVTVSSEALTLTPISLGDAAELTDALQDQRISQTTEVPWPYTLEMAHEHLTSVADAWEKGDADWAIRLRGDGTLVGRVNLWHQERVPGSFEIGYFVRADHWGQGVMTEALKLAVNTAFEHFGAERILWYAHVGNWGSWKPAWRCGFQKEGIERRPGVSLWKAGLLKGDPMEPSRPWDGPGGGHGPALDPARPGDLVAQFHSTYSMPNRLADRGHPTVHFDRIGMRLALISEEFAELVGALHGPTARATVEQAVRDAVDASDGTLDVVEAADALGDLIYVIYGMALECGIDLDAVLAEIQASNLSKLMPDGSVLLREDGKVLKGPNFFPPDIARALGISRTK